ncbi:MAG: acyl-CoA/acyl-ACP dehydrogenase [Deltaproteobacteria bacterium]|nr:acyl-CoA/acyl-ACP dehydrogenase [Deltaproteobacteria bacterium]
MDYYNLKYGLFADAPDLVDTLPALGKLKKAYPKYIKRAEEAQCLARKFAREELLPKVLEIDTKCSKDPKYMDWELWRKANDARLNISPIPKKMGGLGWSALDNAVLVEELSSVCIASAANITFNTFGLLGALVECRTGTVLKIIKMMVDAQQKGKSLFWSWAITEPGAGTDVEDGEAMATMRPSSNARKAPGGYILNGTKCFITNGSIADYVIATIPLDTSNPRESMATFFVSTDSTGFSVGRVERKCGQKASQTAELFFNDLFVPEENLWEPPGRGLRHTREILSITRGYVGLCGSAIAGGALQRCVQFANRKKIKNHRLIEEEWVQFAISDMLKDIMVVRAACYNFALAMDTYHVWSLFDKIPVKASLAVFPEKFILGESVLELAQNRMVGWAGNKYKGSIVTDDLVEKFVKEGSALKVAGTDLAMKVSARVLDVVGLEGMSYQYGIEKYFRDAKVTQIYEGSNQANRIDLFNNTIGEMI